MIQTYKNIKRVQDRQQDTNKFFNKKIKIKIKNDFIMVYNQE